MKHHVYFSRTSTSTNIASSKNSDRPNHDSARRRYASLQQFETVTNYPRKNISKTLFVFSFHTARTYAENHRASQRFTASVCRPRLSHHHHDGAQNRCAQHCATTVLLNTPAQPIIMCCLITAGSGINVVSRQQQKVVVSHIAMPGTLTSSTSKHQQVSVQGVVAAAHNAVPVGKNSTIQTSQTYFCDF